MTHPSIHARTHAEQDRLPDGGHRQDDHLSQAQRAFEPGRPPVSLARPEGRRPHRALDGKPLRLHGDLLIRTAKRDLLHAIGRYLTEKEIAHIVKDSGAAVHTCSSSIPRTSLPDIQLGRRYLKNCTGCPLALPDWKAPIEENQSALLRTVHRDHHATRLRGKERLSLERLSQPLTFTHGPIMPNCLALSPITSDQAFA